MDWSLCMTALLLGLAGSPHCLGMCGAACAALHQGRWQRALGWQVGRLLSYATGGAVVAASVSGLTQWASGSSWVRPLWVLLHMAALGLGLYLLWRGRQPAWVENLGRAAPRTYELDASRLVGAGGGGGSNGAMAAPKVVFAGVARPTLAGLVWLAWPCGLLQSALMVAALASGPVQGALVMGGFALTSGVGLVVGPLLFVKLMRSQRGMVWAVRISGAMLAASAVWALGHGVWRQVQAFCS
ncbi:sulfite exporter TauE/SafE family protein [Roseateles sp. BYS180W]|uniref:Sulfite exporter TauE/SafE family protein n=1 Tax=Roseateles rivi TaxID=3299028 RepID=A0ABW7FYR4_9BURK